MDALTRNWLVLLVLTAGTVVLGAFAGALASAVLLALSWSKARVILGGYLHLSGAPAWLGLIMVPLGFWLVVIWGVNLLATW